MNKTFKPWPGGVNITKGALTKWLEEKAPKAPSRSKKVEPLRDFRASRPASGKEVRKNT